MIRSRARLVVRGAGGRTLVATARAQSPQRWAVRRVAGGRIIDATHQVIGDGYFGGERYETSIHAEGGSTLVVRGLAATPLRMEAPSVSLVRIRARDEATMLYLPGAIIPQSGSDHTAALHVSAAEGTRVLVASVITPGRTGMGEYGLFRRLRMRTIIDAGGIPALAEDSTISPHTLDLQGRAMLGTAEAALTIVAVGAWPAAHPEWWAPLEFEGIVGGAQPLARAGIAYRGLCETLGDAQRALAAIERAALLPG